MEFVGALTVGRGVEPCLLPVRPSGVTILFGKNGSGKTRLVEATCGAVLSARLAPGAEFEAVRASVRPIGPPGTSPSTAWNACAVVGIDLDDVEDRALWCQHLAQTYLTGDERAAVAGDTDALATVLEDVSSSAGAAIGDRLRSGVWAATNLDRRPSEVFTEHPDLPSVGARLIDAALTSGRVGLAGGRVWPVLLADQVSADLRSACRDLASSFELTPLELGELFSYDSRVPRIVELCWAVGSGWPVVFCDDSYDAYDRNLWFLKEGPPARRLGVKSLEEEMGLGDGRFTPSDPFRFMAEVLPDLLVLSSSLPAEERAVTRLSRFLRTHLTRRSTGGGDAYDLAQAILNGIAERATELAPAFVREWGDLTLRVEHPRSPWDAPRVDARCGVLHLSQLGLGVATWAAHSVEVAVSQLERGGASRQGTLDGQIALGRHLKSGWKPSDVELHFDDTTAGLVVIDEPEIHLHDQAIQDAVGFVERLTLGGAAVLMATHSTRFLSCRPDAQLVGLVSPELQMRTDAGHTGEQFNAGTPEDPDWVDAETEAEYLTRVTQLGMVSSSMLKTLGERADDLGTDIHAVLAITNGWLFVEGHNDRWVIEQYFAEYLDQHRIRVLPLHGGLNAGLLPELEFMWQYGKPVAIALDYIRRGILEQIRDGKSLSGHLHYEEQWLDTLGRRLRYDQGKRTLLTGIDRPDIICFIPAPDMRGALESLGKDPKAFPGWKPLLDGWADRGSFKEFFTRTVGVGPDTLLGQLRTVGLSSDPPRGLEKVIREVSNFITKTER